MMQKAISEMSDRELRIYKRQLKKQRELRRRRAVLLVLTTFILLAAFSYQSFQASAKEKDADIPFKYYTNVTVFYGETAWDIAERYIDYKQYKDKNDYIQELQSINHLDEDCNIFAGQSLIVPYFSHDYVK